MQSFFIVLSHDIPIGDFKCQTWIHRVVKVPPFVHPNFGHASRVFVHDFGHAPRKGVGRLVPEHVADVRARHDLQSATALPHLIFDVFRVMCFFKCVEITHPKGHFEILAAPNVHSLVVASDLVEIIAIDAEQATGHRRRSQRLTPIAVSSVHFALRNAIPTEIEFPVEAAPSHVRGRHVLEVFIGDDVDDGADHGSAVLGHFGQEWLEPAFGAFAVGV